MRTDRSPRALGPAALVVGAAAAVGAGLLGGALALGAHFARRVLTPARAPEAGVEVLALETAAGGGQRVWLQGPDAALSGRYSFIFDGGASHARLGGVVDRSGEGADERVARDVLGVDRGSLRPGARGRVTGWWFADPAEIGLETRRVEIPLEGGSGWAWLVEPGSGSDVGAAAPGRWAVHVHGRGALPEETLRGVAPFARAGVTSLVIAYRNDPGAPRGLRGRYGLGLAERRDVDAAIAWARERGAERVTLAGCSMGGTACLLAAQRGPQRGLVDGLVLDSPAVDWPGVLRQQARLAGVPAWVGSLGRFLLQRGIVRGAVPGERRTDVDALTPESFAAGLRLPVLIHASPDDTFVPWQGSLRLARLRPELVSLREGAGEHVKLWNTDPEGWEAATERFVRELPDPRAPRAD